MGRDRWFLVPGRMFGWCGYIFGPVYGHILVGTKSGCAAGVLRLKWCVRLVVEKKGAETLNRSYSGCDARPIKLVRRWSRGSMAST